MRDLLQRDELEERPAKRPRLDPNPDEVLFFR